MTRVLGDFFGVLFWHFILTRFFRFIFARLLSQNEYLIFLSIFRLIFLSILSQTTICIQFRLFECVFSDW